MKLSCKRMAFSFLAAVLSVAGLLLSSAEASAQKVTVKGNAISLAQVVEAVEQQTNYLFIYNENVDLNKKVPVNLADASIETVLATVFAGTGITYSISGSNITLTPEPVQQQQAPVSRTVSGTVTDNNGLPVMGASVMIDGTTVGVVTDLDGRYSLTVPSSYKNANLVFSSLGYELWLKYAERMCFLLSQGDHVCDIAIMYPTETMQAIPGTKADATFAVSDSLSTHGLDYDFIDYQSLQNAVVENGCLKVGGESYKVLVFADTQAMHKETLAKVREFRKAGGKVVVTGRMTQELRKIGTVVDRADIVSAVSNMIDSDFKTIDGRGRVLHRRIGDRDVYMVMDVREGDSMHFRACGKVESWNAMDGTVSALPVLGRDGDGTWVRYDGPSDGSMLIVFSPGEPETAGDRKPQEVLSELHLGGNWDIEIIPTMDNKWGDFRLPASDGFIGVEARVMDYRSADGRLSGHDIYGYGPYMLSCSVPSSADIDSLLVSDLGGMAWKPYVWSWQYGVPDSPGSQGWHGLKCRVDPCFLILDQGAHQLFRTDVLVPADGDYQLLVEGTAPYAITLDGSPVRPGSISLSEGRHVLLLAYRDTRKTEYSLRGMRGDGLDKRDRSMVMLYPAGSEEPKDHGMYEDIVASRWYDSGALVYEVPGSCGSWTFSFETAPGTAAMDFSVHGELEEILIDGVPAVFSDDGDGHVHLEISRVNPGISTVTVTGTPDVSFPGAAFFAGPVRLSCSGGRMPEGDWTAFGAMASYSGAVRYSRDVELDFREGRVMLDLGDVDATCEVVVNGSEPRVLIGKPYSLDITDSVQSGPNHIDVLVYSSLANHYSTIPSPYRGTARAGLIGPAKLLNVK